MTPKNDVDFHKAPQTNSNFQQAQNENMTRISKSEFSHVTPFPTGYLSAS